MMQNLSDPIHFGFSRINYQQFEYKIQLCTELFQILSANRLGYKSTPLTLSELFYQERSHI